MVNSGVKHVVRLVVDNIPLIIGDLQYAYGAVRGGFFCLFFLSIKSTSRSYDFAVHDIPPLAHFEGDLPSVSVEIYGSINVKIVLQYYVGTRSLYIQEGCQDKGRKIVPMSRCLGT